MDKKSPDQKYSEALGALPKLQLPKFCVFCGNAPNSKNREHVFPQWLLNLTGNPKRQFNLGLNPHTRQPRRFAADQFVAPACQDCNENFGRLEEKTKPIVECLITGKTIQAHDYSTLLDWFDKIRVGVWLTFILLDKNLLDLRPSFHIAKRIGRKDRMLAIYPIEGESIGLTFTGSESIAFSLMPSAFSLRINNMHFVNASSDFMIAARSGFPFPSAGHFDLDLGGIVGSQIQAFGYIKSPLLRMRLHKPSVLLFQPIIQIEDWESAVSKKARQSILNQLLESTSGKGQILRQWPDCVEVLKPDDYVEFDSINRHEGRRTYELNAQLFELQNHLIDQRFPVRAENNERRRQVEKLYKEAKTWNIRYSAFHRRRAAARHLSNQPGD